jgi:FkbM family methyltransferase
MCSCTVGSDTWLLRNLKGARISDRVLLNIIRYSYLALRVLLRIVFGRKNRNILIAKRGINFSNFLYKSVEVLRLNNYLFIVFEEPNLDYKFCSKITRKIKNYLILDVYMSMTRHEQEILLLFNPKIGDTVVDIGAAFGRYTLHGSKRVGAKGRVISIEPDYQTFSLLNRNISINNLGNVKSLQIAAYSKKVNLKLYSNYTVIPDRAGMYIHEFQLVKGDTLDNILEEEGVKDVKWLKIDVDGAEVEVLKGAFKTLSQNDLMLFIETHGELLYHEVVQIISLFNFTIQFERSHDNGTIFVACKRSLTKIADRL